MEINVRASGTSRVKFAPGSRLLALGLVLTGIGGAFAPWIWRESVALQLTGPGLAEFVKFLPEVRTGQVQVQRLYFLLPLFMAMLLLPVLSAQPRLPLPGWGRWFLRLVTIPLALASLSPVWTPAILVAPEFRLQTLLASIAIGLAVVAPLLKRLPPVIPALLAVGGGPAALGLPLWQFKLVQAGISQAYHEPVSPGWGWWLTAGGIVLSMVAGIWIIALHRTPRP